MPKEFVNVIWFVLFLSSSSSLFFKVAADAVANKSATSSALESYSPEEGNLKRWLNDNCSLAVDARPVRNYPDPLNVEVFFIPYRLIKLSDQEELFSIVGEFDVSWVHPCAKWSPTIIGNSHPWSAITEVFLVANSIWRPPLMHISGIDDVPFTTSGESSSVVKVANDGKVTLMVVKNFQSTCNLFLSKFPFDTQSCSLIFESQIRNTLIDISLVDIVISKGIPPVDNLNEFISDAKIWQLDSTSAVVVNQTYPALDCPFHRAIFTFTMTRKCTYYQFSLMIPTTILVVLQLSFIAIPPWIADRPAYCATIVMAFGIQQSMIQADIPKTSEIVLIVVLTSGQTLLSMTCTLYALLTCMLSDKPKNEPVTRIGNWVFKVPRVRVCDAFFFSFVVVAVLLLYIIIFGLIFSV